LQAFAMFIDDGVIKKINIAEAEDDPAGDANPGASLVEQMLLDIPDGGASADTDRTPQPDKGSLDVTFKGGEKMGIGFHRQTGVVDQVAPGTPADLAGVKVGWAIVDNDGHAFTYDDFKVKAAGDQDFVIRFASKAGLLSETITDFGGRPTSAEPATVADPAAFVAESIAAAKVVVFSKSY
jgi:predicted metalloprotease with PDZ domain